MDEGGGYAICRVGIRRGRRIQRLPGCRTIRTEGGGNGRINIDNVNMATDAGFSNVGSIMSAMREAQGKGSAADRKGP